MATKEMPALLDINSEMDMLIEGIDDYLESDIRSLTKQPVKCIFLALPYRATLTATRVNG